MKAVIFTVALFFASLASWAQSPIVTPNAVDLHITQETSRDQLAQMQQSLHAAGIGFRYDLVAWEGNALQSIRMAVRLADGTLQTTELESFNSETDVRIQLSGTGENRIFCVGTACPE
jgi:hypothetical protein